MGFFFFFFEQLGSVSVLSLTLFLGFGNGGKDASPPAQDDMVNLVLVEKSASSRDILASAKTVGSKEEGPAEG